MAGSTCRWGQAERLSTDSDLHPMEGWLFPTVEGPNRQGDQMPPSGPPGLTDVPEPRDLLHVVTRHGEVNWGADLPTSAEIARLYGVRATVRSLQLLRHAVATEPRITAEFLAALPSTGSQYQLASRIKSPQSLARKLADRPRKGRSDKPPEDILRYTMLTQVPETLVAAARHTADELTKAGWQIQSAMQSYTEGSRYKGIHALIRTPSDERVEVQFHSVASARVKELTTPYYEIERSAAASAEERTGARRECIRLSATLTDPPELTGLSELGGRQVRVNNYSDSRTGNAAKAPALAEGQRHRLGDRSAALTTTDGINR
ncbi:hypothetical protein [Streptomyces sp. SID13031]|uniref:hypothetical protein n=1 Tax=Streptomyces sp. SID13031 TaxID=2706046 RepID=UPI0013CB2434|nr:hypothetical protein [Streptomyces sp. SID13031]NEA32263.1 hypothetical protein [Streptomyces sp. SID13031]